MREGVNGRTCLNLEFHGHVLYSILSLYRLKGSTIGWNGLMNLIDSISHRGYIEQHGLDLDVRQGCFEVSLLFLWDTMNKHTSVRV